MNPCHVPLVCKDTLVFEIDFSCKGHRSCKYTFPESAAKEFAALFAANERPSVEDECFRVETNRYEYVARFDPNVINKPFTIDSLGNGDAETISLIWKGVEGRAYQVKRAAEVNGSYENFGKAIIPDKENIVQASHCYGLQVACKSSTVFVRGLGKTATKGAYPEVFTCLQERFNFPFEAKGGGVAGCRIYYVKRLLDFFGEFSISRR